MALKTYSGSCHCGAVRFQADLDLAAGTMRCNCSLCSKARAWFAFARGAERFRLGAGADALSEYRWTPAGRPHPGLTYAFCKHCGIRAFARGELESLGGTFHAVPIAVLDDVPAAEHAEVPIRFVDGKSGDYDHPPQDTRWL